MKMIWITQESVFPLNSGGRIGVFKRLEKVCKENEIYLFYTYDNDEETQYVAELEKYCKRVYAYKRKKNVGALFRSLRYPFCIASRSLKSMRKDLEKCIIENDISIVNVDFPQMCINLFTLSLKYNLKIILNEHNIEWQFYAMISKSSKSFLKKFAYWFDGKRLKRYEEHLTRHIRFKAITFVSEKDIEIYREWLGLNVPHILIPVGADIQQISFDNNKRGANILFVGKMSADTNEEAVIWFAECVLPTIISLIPSAKFYIVGKDPTDRVKALENANVNVTGTVNSVSAYYELADLVVLPLLHGSGVKVKLLEAISYKKPLVTTEIGVEGTTFKNGQDLFVENDPKHFAEKCVLILSNSEIYEKLSNSSYKKFCENYTWEKTGKKYVEVLNSVNNDSFNF